MWNHVKEVFKWIGFLILCFVLWLVMLFLVGHFQTIIPFVICFVGVFPILEEWFKSNHSNTWFKAHLFGLLEFLFVAFAVMVATKVPMDQRISIITAKIMSMVMHFATGMMYYKYGNSIKVFLYGSGLHMLFNAIIRYAHIQHFEIVLFVPYMLLYISNYFVKQK